MAILVTDNKKNYEKPGSGAFVGVIADVVDLGIIATTFGNKSKVRIVWVLGKIDGSGYAVDSEGNPFRVMSELTASIHEKSDLFKLIRGVLGTPPPAGPYDVEQLLGRSNQLFIVREKSKDGQREFANVKGILPLPAGVPSLAIPANFVRRGARNTAAGAAAPVAAPAVAAAPFTPAVAPSVQAAPLGVVQSTVTQPAVSGTVTLDKDF